MLPIIGVVVLLVMVFGGYIMAGGKIGIILQALPFEMMMIGGAAVGAFLIGNGMNVAKDAGKGFVLVLKGPHFKKDHYLELLVLLGTLLKTAKTRGLLSLETHIERPEQSDIFNAHPLVVHDKMAVPLICDAMRAMSMGMDDPMALEDMMDRQIKRHHHEELQAAEALQTTSDALPALGIVAAVLGVIKTMASIDQPPAVLGKLIGSALVGTFLGVFLSYGLVGPIAGRLKQIVNQDGQFYKIIRDALVSHLRGNAAQISIEIARGNVPGQFQPSFADVEAALNSGAPAAPAGMKKAA